MDGSAKVSLILELKERIKAGLNSAKAYVNKNVQEMKDRLNSLKTTHINVFKAMESEIPGFSQALAAIRNPFILITAAIVAMGASYGKAASMALDWETKMAHANVTAGLTKKELSGLSDELRAIGTRNVAPLETVPDAFNRIISAGLDTNTALKALEPTLRAAKAGFTDMETTAAAGVGVMNASGEDINKVYDVLFATLNKGTAEFKDVAQYLPKIIPNARAAGFALGETAGAWAYLTAQGRNAEQSTTGLTNVFKALSNPTTTAGLKDIGVSVYDATGKMRPLISIVTDLSKKVANFSNRKRASVLGALGIDMEGMGALNTMLQDTGKLNDIINFTTNSTGQLDEAYKNSAQSGDSWAIINNKIKDTMLGIGMTALPVIDRVGKWFLDNGPVLEYFAYSIGGVALAWGTYLLVTNAATIATTVWTAAQWLLNAALTANPVGLIITAIGLLIGALVYAWNHCAKFRAALSGILEVGSLLLDLFMGFGKVLAGVFTFNPSLITQGMAQGAKAMNEIMNGGITARFNKGYDDSMATSAAKDKENHPDAFADKKTGAKTDGKPGKKDNKLESDSENKITGGAKQVHNITVHIDAFNKGGINTTNTQGLQGKSAKEIEEWFNNMLLRAIRELETSYS